MEHWEALGGTATSVCSRAAALDSLPPPHRYEDYDHIGYDVAGNKVEKRPQQSGLERAIAGMDDPELAKRTVYDALNDREVRQQGVVVILVTYVLGGAGLSAAGRGAFSL